MPNPKWIKPTGAELIAAERTRQMSEEGWTPEHDAEHEFCELAVAANCYVNHSVAMVADKVFIKRVPTLWPWLAKWWKPSSDPVRNLVKAGALIAAEIDRLRRAKPEEEA